MAGIDISTIVVKTKSDGIDELTKKLDQMATVAELTEKKTTSMSSAISRSSSANSTAADGAQKYTEKLINQANLIGKNTEYSNAYNMALRTSDITQIAVAASLGKSIDEYKASQKAMADAEKATKSLAAAQTAAMSALQAEANAMNKAWDKGVAMNAMGARQEELAKIREGADSGSEAMKRLGLNTVGAKRELMVLAHEVLQGNFSRIPGSVMVLGERSSALGKVLGAVFSPMGALFAGVAASIGLVVYEMVKGHQQFVAMQESLKSTNDYVGMTTDSMREMANTIGVSSLSTADKLNGVHDNTLKASEALTTLAGTGKFTGSQLKDAGIAAVEMSQDSHKSISDVVKSLENLSGNALKWSEEYQKQHHFMSAAQAELVISLDREGKQAEATTVVLKALQEAHTRMYSSAQKEAGSLQVWWNEWGNVIDKVKNKLMSMGAETPYVTKNLELLQKIDEQKAKYRPAENATEKANIDANIAALYKEIDANTKLAKAEESRVKTNEAIGKGGDLAFKIDAYTHDYIKTKENNATKQVEIEDRKYKELYDLAAGNNKAQEILTATHEQNLLDIQEKYRSKKTPRDDRMAIANNDIAVMKHISDVSKAELERQEKDNQYFFDSGKKTESDYYAFKSKNISDIASLEDKFYEAESKRLQKVADNSKDHTQKEEVLKRIEDIGRVRELAATKYKGELVDVSRAESDAESHYMDKANAYSSKLLQEVEAQERLADTHHSAKRAIDTFTQAQEDATAATLKKSVATAYDAMMLASCTNDTIAFNKAQAEYNRLVALSSNADYNASLKARDDAAKAANAKNVAAIASAKLLTKELDQQVALAKSFEVAMTKAFGNVGKAIGGIGVALAENAKVQNQITQDAAAQTAIQTAGLDKVTDAEQIAAVTKQNNNKADYDSKTTNLKLYGDMAEASKGFFEAGSKGYKIMDTVSKAFHAAEMIRTMASIVPKIMAGAASFFAQSGWGGFAGVAAMAAVMGGLGYSMSSGGSSGPDVSAAAVQKSQGTGTVFGDATAKSDSIMKSMDLLSKNSTLMLPLTSQMASSLKAMENGIAGLTNLVIRTPGTSDATNMGISGGVTSSAMSTFNTKMSGLLSLGILNGVTNKISNALFGSTSKSVTDSGLQIGGSVGSLESGAGIDQYANIQTVKKGGLFGKSSTSNNIQTQAASDEISKQFGLVFKNLESVLVAAAGGLGKQGDVVAKAVESFVLDATKVSFKGLSGDDLQKAINAVLSGAMDKISESVFPELDAFRQIGEGYSQTVVRVASGIEVAGNALDKFGIKAINYTDIINKQGDVTAEIARQSIEAVEQQNGVLNGVGKIIGTLQGTSSDLITIYQSLVDVRKLMRAVNLNKDDLGVSLIGGAGGVDKLSSGLSTYQDKFFTDAEKLKAQMSDLADQFALLGVAVPADEAAFRALVDATGTSTDATATLTGKLLTMSGAFASASEQAKKVADQQMADAKSGLISNVENAFSALQKAVDRQKQTLQKAFDDQIKFLQDQATASSTALDNIKSVFDALNSALTAARPLSREAAQGILQGALASSNAGGSLTKVEGLNEALQAVAQPAKNMFSTFVEYQRDQLRTNNVIASLKDNASAQVSVAQLTLDAINSSIDAITKAHEEEVARLDDLISVAQAQVDAIKGVDNSIMSVAEAIANFNTASTAAGGGTISAASASLGASGSSTGGFVNGLYQAPAYSPADIASGKIWSESDSGARFMQAHESNPITGALEYVGIGAGHTYNDLRSNLLSSLPSFDVGTNYVTHDMTANIHRGERIIPAADNKQLMAHMSNSTSNSGMEILGEKIDTLTQEMHVQGLANVQNSAAILKIQKKWDGEGTPPVRNYNADGSPNVIDVHIV